MHDDLEIFESASERCLSEILTARICNPRLLHLSFHTSVIEEIGKN